MASFSLTGGCQQAVSDYKKHLDLISTKQNGRLKQKEELHKLLLHKPVWYK